MFNKKCIAKLVALGLTLSCLTACAGNGAGTTGAAADQPDQQAENTTAEAAAADTAAGTEEVTEAKGAEADAAKDAAADTAKDTAADAADTADYTTGTPWPCIDLEGVVTPDIPADLKDNFALAVNRDKILAGQDFESGDSRRLFFRRYDDGPGAAAGGRCEKDVPRRRACGA